MRPISVQCVLNWDVAPTTSTTTANILDQKTCKSLPLQTEQLADRTNEPTASAQVRLAQLLATRTPAFGIAPLCATPRNQANSGKTQKSPRARGTRTEPSF